MAERYSQNNNGFLSWLITGRPSFTLYQPREGKIQTRVWDSLVYMSRGHSKGRMPISGTAGLAVSSILYAAGQVTDDEALPTSMKFFSYIRAGLLGIVQLFDTLAYSPVMFFSLLQLGAEVAFQKIGQMLGLFGEKRFSDNPYVFYPVALLVLAPLFVVTGAAAIAFRLIVFVAKPFADAAGLLLNVANIGFSILVGAVASVFKWFSPDDFSSLKNIWKGVVADIAFPFSAALGGALAFNLGISKSHYAFATPKPLPTPSWPTILGYAVAAAAVGFFAATTGGLGLISKPLIPVIAEVVAGAIGGFSTIAAGWSVKVSIGIALFGFVDSFVKNTGEAVQNLAKPVTPTTTRESPPVIPAGVKEEKVSVRTTGSQHERVKKVIQKFITQLDSKKTSDLYKEVEEEPKETQEEEGRASESAKISDKSETSSGVPDSSAGADTEGYYGDPEKTPDDKSEDENEKPGPK